MLADVEIGNLSLQKMGEEYTIISLFPPDAAKPAREINKCFHAMRRAELRAHRWSFAKGRGTMASLSDTPVGGEYLYQYQLPSDCLSVRTIGNTRQEIICDYKTGMERLYSIEGKKLLTNLTSPLAIVYTVDVQDTSLFDACFDEMLSCRISLQTCEIISQSDVKKESIRKDYRIARGEALRAGSIELPPQPLGEFSFVTSRL